MRSNLIDVEVLYKHETDSAVLVASYEQAKPVWLPKSQIEFHLDSSGNIVFLTLPRPLAEEKGLV